MPATRTVLRVLLIAIALAAGAVLLGIIPFNAGFARGPIEAAVRDATGLQLSIGDSIMLRLGPTPSITAGGIVYGDRDDSPLLTIDSLYAKISLIALLRGHIYLRELRARGLRIDYCSRYPETAGGADEEPKPPSIIIDVIELEQIGIRCGPATETDPYRIDLDRLVASAAETEDVQLDATGTASGFEFTVKASGGNLDRLLAGAEPFPVHVTLDSAAGSTDIAGHLSVPLDFDAQLDVELNDVQSFARAFGSNVPPVGALSLSGRVRAQPDAFAFDGFTGWLGESRFAFDATVDAGDERPSIGLNATIEELDLAPVLSDMPTSPSSDPDQQDADIDLGAAIDLLDSFDADMQLVARNVREAPLAFSAFEVAATLSAGLLELQSLTADILDGHVTLAGSLDSQHRCPELTLQVLGESFGLASLNPVLQSNREIDGRADKMRFDSTSCGRSLQSHRDSLRAVAEVSGIRAQVDGEPLPIAADRLVITLRPEERSRVQLVGKLADERLEVTMAAGSLIALLGSEPWPLDLDAVSAGGRLRMGGRAGLVSGHPFLDARVIIEAADIGTLRSWTSGSPDAGLPLHVKSKLRLDESRFAAEEIAVSLGSSDLSGHMRWDHAADPDVLDLNVHSSYLDLDELGRAAPPEAGDSGSTRPDAGDNPQKSARITLPPVDFELNLEAVHGGRLDLQDLLVSARLRKGLIDSAKLSVVVEDEIYLHGDLDLDVRQLPAVASLKFSADNLDIGRVFRRLEVDDDLNLRADTLELIVTANGSTPRQLLVNTLVEANLGGFSWNLPRESSVDESERDLDLSLDELRLTMAPDRPTTWLSSGRFDDVRVELWMQTPSLVDVLALDELPLTLIVAAANDVAMFEGTIDRTSEDRFLAQVRLSGEVIDSANRTLADLPSPLADYQLTSTVRVTDDRLELPDLKMRIGSSSASGEITTTLKGERRRVDVMLRSPLLQTDDLLYWSTNFRNATAADGAPEEEPGETAVADDEPAPDRGVLQMARDIITETRERSDLAIDISVDEVHSGEDVFGGGEIHLYVDESAFRLEPIVLNLPGGGVDAAYTTMIDDDRLRADLRVRVDALRYGGLLRLIDHESESRGLIYVDLNLGTNTDWTPDDVPINLLFENAQGSIELAAWPENVEAGLLDLWSANLVLALLPAPSGGEVSRLNCIVSRFDVEAGVMKSRATLLDTTDTIIRGSGTINLKEEQLDLLAGPQAKREKFLSASTPIKVTGSFDDFQIGVEPAGFLGTLTKWYMSLIYVPFKWLTGERFPPDGTPTCFDAMDWELTPELHEYFLRHDFTAPLPVR